MRIAIIVSMAQYRVIGLNGSLPWDLPDDQRQFSMLTKGNAKAVIMGRRTHESLGCVLPGRLNIVVTSQLPFIAKGCQVAPSVPEALKIAERAKSECAFFIGGAQIYKEALPLAELLYMTRIYKRYKGDAHFPIYNRDDWFMQGAAPGPYDAEHDFTRFKFQMFEKRRINENTEFFNNQVEEDLIVHVQAQKGRVVVV